MESTSPEGIDFDQEKVHQGEGNIVKPKVDEISVEAEKNEQINNVQIIATENSTVREKNNDDKHLV